MEKNKILRNKISAIIQFKPNKHQYNDAKHTYYEALKNPYFQPDLPKLTLELEKAYNFMKNWREKGKPSSIYSHVFLDYDNLYFTIDEVQQLKNQLKKNQQYLQILQRLAINARYEDSQTVEAILDEAQQKTVLSQGEGLQKLREKYIQFWGKCIKREQQIKKNIITYQKLKKLLLDSYYLLQYFQKNNLNDINIKQPILIFERILKGIKQLKKSNIKNNLYEQYIDIQQLNYEIQNGINIEQQIIILQPYLDIIKFKYKNIKTYYIPKDQRIKRNYVYREEIKENQEDCFKKQNKSQEEIRINNAVTQNDRKKIREILLKNIKKNNQLNKYVNSQNQIKMIENQIFGDWHNNIIKYFQMSQSFQKVFIKLQLCPHMSKKLIQKKFQFKFLQLLVQNINKIQKFENIMQQKLLQKQRQNTFNKMTFLQSNKQISTKQSIFDMIAKGNVDQNVRKQLKRDIKMIKQSRNKRKKHHRNRSHSNSPDAKFSSQSDDNQQQLPSYIQNQYSNKDPTLTPYQRGYIISDQYTNKDQAPLMFDPEQDNQEETVNYPKGSILLLKELTVEILLKKKGKIDLKAQMLTMQEYKKILLELVDPNCGILSIRKQKSDTQIIGYLNKPSRKKYKYLVGWLQGSDKTASQNLQELSIEANERHKIFGWQNQHIKIHVMSIHQLVQIPKFAPYPNKVTNEQNAQIFKDQRMVFVIQYPAQKMYQLKGIYQNFNNIKKKQFQYQVTVPIFMPPIPSNQNPYFMTYNFNQNLSTPNVQPIKYQGWGESNQTVVNEIPEKTFIQPTNPYNTIRVALGFGPFELIQSDQQDPQKDLAGTLLKDIKTSRSSNAMQARHITSQPQPQFQDYSQGYRPNQWENQSYNYNNPMYSNKHPGGSNVPIMGMNTGTSMNAGQNPMNPNNQRQTTNNPMFGINRMNAHNQYNRMYDNNYKR